MVTEVGTRVKERRKGKGSLKVNRMVRKFEREIRGRTGEKWEDERKKEKFRMGQGIDKTS
jgi:hypothetical protein